MVKPDTNDPVFTQHRLEFEQNFPDDQVEWKPEHGHYRPSIKWKYGDGVLMYCMRRDRELQIWLRARGIMYDAPL